jgi:hypothetical protein
LCEVVLVGRRHVSETLVEVMPDADALASAVAARFVLTILDKPAARPTWC